MRSPVRHVIDAAILPMALGVVVFAWAFPGTMLVFTPGLRARDRFCSRWAAVRDGSSRLREENSVAWVNFRSRVVGSDGSLRLWHTPDGEFWVPPGPDRLLPILLVQQRRNLYGEGEQGVKAGDVVIDCGAHVGVFARKALASGARLVVAVEPTPETLECLRRNFAAEISRGAVAVVAKGVWDSEGELTLYSDGGNAGAGNTFLGAEGAPTLAKVPVTTIDRIVGDMKLDHVDFIKMDIKGAAERAISGAKETIRRDHPRLAISTETVSDNPERLTHIVHSLQPAYRLACGRCVASGSDLVTEVIHFY